MVTANFIIVLKLSVHFTFARRARPDSAPEEVWECSYCIARCSLKFLPSSTIQCLIGICNYCLVCFRIIDTLAGFSEAASNQTVLKNHYTVLWDRSSLQLWQFLFSSFNRCLNHSKALSNWCERFSVHNFIPPAQNYWASVLFLWDPNAFWWA